MTSLEDASNSAANSAATWWSPWQMVAGPKPSAGIRGGGKCRTNDVIYMVGFESKRNDVCRRQYLRERKIQWMDETLHKLIGGFSHYL